MTVIAGPTLDAAQRERLAQLADVLIPGGEGLPAASAADTLGKWIDRALAVRPEFGDVLVRAAAAPGEPDEAIERLRSDDPLAFDDLTAAICGAYLLNPRVRRTLGYPGPAPKQQPPLPDEAEYYLGDGILDPVVARGPIYRPTPPEVA